MQHLLLTSRPLVSASFDASTNPSTEYLIDVVVENKDSLEPWVTSEQTMKVCNHNFGIGADGVIFAMPGLNDTDYSMRIFNSDSSEPEKQQAEEKNLQHCRSTDRITADSQN
ncbi:hypothetical protein KSP39_PZI012842 [Platanthera zijinensis]|uniref:Uncharacterized protein n=1 Tax=Platanthera zijinensis TaxID=2320716 RepID=A0AAP0G395_9ASPA